MCDTGGLSRASGDDDGGGGSLLLLTTASREGRFARSGLGRWGQVVWHNTILDVWVPDVGELSGGLSVLWADRVGCTERALGSCFAREERGARALYVGMEPW